MLMWKSTLFNVLLLNQFMFTLQSNDQHPYIITHVFVSFPTYAVIPNRRGREGDHPRGYSVSKGSAVLPVLSVIWSWVSVLIFPCRWQSLWPRTVTSHRWRHLVAAMCHHTEPRCEPAASSLGWPSKHGRVRKTHAARVGIDLIKLIKSSIKSLI